MWQYDIVITVCWQIYSTRTKQLKILTQSGIQTPRSLYTTLSKLSRLSAMPPNSSFSSWHIVMELVIDTGDFCFDVDSFPDESMPSTAT